MLTTKLGNRYEVASELGRGGMGVVYRARDPLLNREVAVKVLATTELTTEIEERFQREAQIVAQMDHPGIVPIYDLGRHDGSLYFVMPLVEGTNLRRILWEGSLKLGEVLDIAIQVATRSSTATRATSSTATSSPRTSWSSASRGPRRGPGHGLRSRATVDRESGSPRPGTLVGTVTYLSPEQVTSHAFDGRSDIYSVGTVLYECLTGEPPFTGEVQSVLYRIVHEVPQPPRALGAEIREELQDDHPAVPPEGPRETPAESRPDRRRGARHRASLQSDEFSRSVILTASRVIQRPAASAFIGREKEFTELQHRLNAAVGGDCQFAVVAGEPGSARRGCSRS
jgi:serine/threonine protein kinase